MKNLNKTVLVVSSQVSYGHVGSSAVVPALQSTGLKAVQIPTVILSNHPGHGEAVAIEVDAATLSRFMRTLNQSGWLLDCKAVMTGYFRSKEQVEVMARTISVLKGENRDIVYLCDPVIGDDHTGLYVSEEIARSIKDKLLPLADIITPNRFELAYLSRLDVENISDAEAAARTLGVDAVLASSIPASPGKIGTAFIDANDTLEVETNRRATMPHGTGDLLAGLFMGNKLICATVDEALVATMQSMEKIMDDSASERVLNLTKLASL